MKQNLTPDFLTPYFRGDKKHVAYKKTVEIMNRLKTHANGEHPSYQGDTKDVTMTNIITDKRPNEDDTTKNYRAKIYVPITKSTVSKVFSSLLKIRKSRDWIIKYNKESISPKLSQGETLEDYSETNYPYFNSVTNWTFNVGLKHYGIDPNGVVAVIPLEMPVADGTFLRPFSFCFDSDQVYDFVQDEYAILYSTDKSVYGQNKQFNDGKVFYVINTERIQRWEQVNEKGDMSLTIDYKHGLAEMPCFKNKGIFYCAMDKIFVWESRLDPIVPRLTEAAREYSDLQAEVVLHMHSEKWVWASQDCPTCNGTGKVVKNKQSVLCTAKGCTGGKIGNSPYETRVVKPGMAGETPAPIPPAGYILKSVDIAKLQNERVREHQYEALSAINMQWMMETPLTQSGKAKEVDRDELNNFVSGIAEDLVWIMDRIYYFNNQYRNMVRIPDKKERLAQLPKIAVPDKFDLISVETSLDMIVKSRTNNLSPQLIVALESEYAAKQFSADPDIKNRLLLYFLLDPLPGLSQETKDAMLMNNGITQIDYIISCNMERFITRAVLENKDFMEMDFDKQNAIIEKYATEKEKVLSAKEKAMKAIEAKNQPPPPTGSEGPPPKVKVA